MPEISLETHLTKSRRSCTNVSVQVYVNPELEKFHVFSALVVMSIVETRMSYLEPWVGRDEGPYVRGKVEESYPRTNFSNQEFPVRVKDARPSKNDFDLDTYGFAFHDAPINSEVVEVIRSKDKEGVENTYYPLVEELVKKHTGASKVIIFDHTYRKKDPSLAPTENPSGKEQPATLVSHSIQCIILVGIYC